MAVTASFILGKLNVFGDNLDNTITESRDAAGNILINGGAVAITGGKPTVANTSMSTIFGQGGNDTITLNEANGALPAVQIFGGAGNDVIHGRFWRRHAVRPGRTTTRSLARAASTCCSAVPAMTSSPAATPTTRCSARPATTA